MKLSHIFYTLALTFGLASCGSSATSTSTTTGDDDTANIVGTIFGSGSSASQSAVLNMNFIRDFARIAQAQGSADTCDNISEGPDEVTSSEIDPEIDDGTETEKTYGATDYTVTLDEFDFCVDSDGNANTETASNPLYAYFEFNSTITATCTDSDEIETEYEMTAATGVHRNDEDAGYYPRIYATFTIDGDEVDCTIFLSEGEDVDFASCLDSGGTELDLNTDNTCEIGNEEE